MKRISVTNLGDVVALAVVAGEGEEVVEEVVEEVGVVCGWQLAGEVDGLQPEQDEVDEQQLEGDEEVGADESALEVMGDVWLEGEPP